MLSFIRVAVVRLSRHSNETLTKALTYFRIGVVRWSVLVTV